MNVLDNAIARLQHHAISSTDVVIRIAPDYPVENAGMLPLSLAYFSQGTAQADTADQMRMLLTVNVDVHFARNNLKDAYTKINAFAPEYLRRLAGDPTLNGSVDTINFPVSFQVIATTWNSIETVMVQFSIQFKELTTPIT